MFPMQQHVLLVSKWVKQKINSWLPAAWQVTKFIQMQFERNYYRFCTFIFKVRSCNPVNWWPQWACNASMQKSLKADQAKLRPYSMLQLHRRTRHSIILSSPWLAKAKTHLSVSFFLFTKKSSCSNPRILCSVL